METGKQIAGLSTSGIDQLYKEFCHPASGPELATISFEVMMKKTEWTTDDRDALLAHFAQCAHNFYFELAKALNSKPSTKAKSN